MPEFEVHAPFAATVAAVAVQPGRAVQPGDTLVVLELMKMEHVVPAPVAGVVEAVHVGVGDTVEQGAALLTVTETAAAAEAAVTDGARDPDAPHGDLEELERRRRLTRDEARRDAVAKRRALGRRTARENIADLCGDGGFLESGTLAIAAQRQRRSVDDLMANTPADGLVCGVGHVNADLFGRERTRCAVLSYDYTVLAGTQGTVNHAKTDRILELAERQRLPVVLFAEGGGGRPGDTDNQLVVSGLGVTTFATMARLSGLVPTVGIVSGRCFAGNAALLGCCDVIIATPDANIGMGGPAMIEGGGLGVFAPEEIGPVAVQRANGVIDVVAADERDAVAIARRYLAYFQGDLPAWSAADQRALRHVVPENRVRVYDVRQAIELLADEGSVLELRRDFGVGIVTALVRVEGRPLGLVANNPAHLGGAIDADGADKMARFLQLCDAHGLPVVSLCDTPGFMVGPAAEATATVRHFSRLFVVGANLSVPILAIVLRKAYGLGAQAMAGGSFREPVATVAWPTGEVGGMGLEGAVRLGMRKELEAVGDPEERERIFAQLVAMAYERGRAVNAAQVFELDEVIDPAETRRWVSGVLGRAVPRRRDGKRRPHVDTW